MWEKSVFLVFCDFLENQKKKVEFIKVKRTVVKRLIEQYKTHCNLLLNKGAMAEHFAYLKQAAKSNFAAVVQNETDLDYSKARNHSRSSNNQGDRVLRPSF
jgi:hypothetical protein